MDIRVPDIQKNKESVKEIKEDLLNITKGYQNTKYKFIVLDTWFLCNQVSGKPKDISEGIKSICLIDNECIKTKRTPLLNKMIFKLHCRKEQKINYTAKCILTYKIITKDDIERKRTPYEIYEWVFSTFDKFITKDEITSLRMLNYPEIKTFVEESYPLALFCHHYFNDSDSIIINQEVGSQSYDAKIIGSDKFHYIEITLAKDGYDEKLRNAELDKSGSVPGFGGVIISGGSKASGKQTVTFENTAVLHDGVKKEQKELILKVVDKKSKIAYPDNTILVVAFDDFVSFRTEEDIGELKDFLEEILEPMVRSFSGLCLVGLSGKLFLSI